MLFLELVLDIFDIIVLFGIFLLLIFMLINVEMIDVKYS